MRLAFLFALIIITISSCSMNNENELLNDSSLNRIGFQTTNSIVDKQNDNPIDYYWGHGKYDKVLDYYYSLDDSLRNEEVDKEIFKTLIMLGDITKAKRKLYSLFYISKNWKIMPSLHFPRFRKTNVKYRKTLEKLYSLSKHNPKNVDIKICIILLKLSSEMGKINFDIDLIEKNLSFFKNVEISFDSDCNYIIGQINMLIGNEDDAKYHFDNVDDHSKFYPYALVNLANIKSNNNSLNMLLKAIKILPMSVEIMNQIAYKYYESKDYPNSVLWFKKSLSLEKNACLEAIYLSKSYFELGKTNLAFAVLDEEIEFVKNIQNTVQRDNYNKIDLSMLFEAKGDLLKSLNELTSSIEFYRYSLDNYDLSSASFSLAEIYRKKGETELAKDYYLRTLDILNSNNKLLFDSNSYILSLFELDIYYQLNEINPTRREELFQRAVEILPDNDWCYVKLGNAKVDLGLYAEGLLCLEEAIRLNSTKINNITTYAFLLYDLKDYDKALINLNKSISLISGMDYDSKSNKKHSQKTLSLCYSKVANIYRNQEKYDDAINNYKKAIKTFSDSTKISFQNEIADVFFRIKDYENAINNWNYVYKKNNDINALYYIGLAYTFMGSSNDLKNAKKCFEEVLIHATNKNNCDSLIKDTTELISIVEKRFNELIWEKILINNMLSKNEIIVLLSRFVQLSNDYNTLCLLFVEGVEETKAVYSQDKKYIIEYVVSPKIFKSEILCDRFIRNLNMIKSDNNDLIKIVNLWSNALAIKKDGIKLYSEGFFVKKKAYTGEFEKGRANIDVADQYYSDGLKIIIEQMHQNIEYFTDYGLEKMKNLADSFGE